MTIHAIILKPTYVYIFFILDFNFDYDFDFDFLKIKNSFEISKYLICNAGKLLVHCVMWRLDNEWDYWQMSEGFCEK